MYKLQLKATLGLRILCLPVQHSPDPVVFLQTELTPFRSGQHTFLLIPVVFRSEA